jgi:transcriptional regulator GlxA family with amidase domain
VRAYRLRLRLALVLDRLRQGANDLADVALEAGFSHHSHMTSACRTLLGHTPSGLRKELGRLQRAA